MDEVYRPVLRLSNGLVLPNLIAGLEVLALTVVLICRPARLTLSDIGLKRSGITPGVIAVLTIWTTGSDSGLE